MRALAIGAAAVLLAGCSITVPVRGTVGGTGEAFTGTASESIDGAGTISITSNQGARCSGTFVDVMSSGGDGILQCEDGRTGSFRFTSTGFRGVGSGTLGDRPITFTFAM